MYIQFALPLHKANLIPSNLTYQVICYHFGGTDVYLPVMYSNKSYNNS
jgi:hypothetical protein